MTHRDTYAFGGPLGFDVSLTNVEQREILGRLDVHVGTRLPTLETIGADVIAHFRTIAFGLPAATCVTGPVHLSFLTLVAEVVVGIIGVCGPGRWRWHGHIKSKRRRTG